MTICKRTVSLILSFLLVFSMFSSTFVFETFAAANPTLSLDSKTVKVAEQFKVNVSLSNAASVYGGNFTLQYDSSLLSADSYTFGSIVSGHTKNCNLDYQSAGNLIRVTFSGAEAVSSDGTLVTFTFTAKKAGTASLQFTSYKMYDENGSSLTTSTSGASVTINPAVTSSPALSITSKTVTAGQTVSVPVSISDSDDVYGGNFTLQYDSSLLSADSYTFGSIVSGHTKNCNLDYQSAGNQIRVTFSGAEAVSSDGTLVTFTFTAKKAGTASLQFTSYKMYDENGSSLDTTVSKGSVVINPEPVVELESIKITQNPTKTQYYIGDSLDTSGLKLKLTYSDGSTETITSGFTTSGFSSSTAGTKTVTVSYEGLTDTFTVTVVDLSSSEVSGTTGDCTWIYNSNNKTLTVSGKGDMANYSDIGDVFAPWHSYEISSVIISDGVTSIGDAAFDNCEIMSVSIGNSVTRIGSNAFCGCNLTYVDIPNSVTRIDNLAFQNCKVMYKIHIGSGLDSIGSKVFYSCTGMETYEVDKDNTLFASKDGVLFDKNMTTLIQYPLGNKRSDYSVPAGVVCIGENAFYQSKNLLRLTLPDTLEKIERGAIASCRKLISVNLPDSVTSIGSSAFEYCTSLTSISIPSKIKTLKFWVFGGCESLTEVIIPDNIAVIESSVFRKCSGLVSITFGNNVIEIGDYAFDECTKLSEVNYYGTKEQWDNISIGTYNGRLTSANRNYLNDPAQNEPIATSISVNKLPDITEYYIEDTLNITGIEMKVSYSDGSTETITSGFITSGFSSSTAGTKTVTVSYGGFTDTFTVTVNTPSITLSSNSKTLTVGDTTTLTATTMPSGQSVTWTSSDTSVATVSNGTITAKAKGTSTITAKFTYNGITYSEVCAVTVNGVVIKPNLSITNKTVTAGQTVSVPVAISDSDDVYGGNFTLQYDSSLLSADSYTFGSIVSGHTKNCNLDYQSAGNQIRVTFSGAEAVSSDGTLVTFTFTAKKAGTASLQFTSYKMYDENGSSLDTTVSKGSVVINPVPVAELESIEITQNPTKTTYYIGDSLNTTGLKLKLTYSDGSTETITSGFTTSGFSSSTAGTKTVTVSYEGFTDTFTITVKTPSITLSSSSKTLSVGDTATLIATTTPSGQSVTWTSSDTSVATVSGGTITAKAKGTSTITAKFTYNGITYSKVCSVTVNRVVVNPYLSITSKTVTAGQTVSVPIAISNSDDVYGGNFTLQYDSSLLSVDSYTFGSIVSGHTKNCNLDYQSAGNLIRVTFSGAEAISSDGTLVTFTFTAKKAGTASLLFTSYKMYDENGSSLDTTVSKGSVVINPEPVVELESIEITQNPTKTQYYIGDSLNTSGLKLKLTYSDGSTENITSGFTTSGFSSSITGTKTVTVSYGGFTDTFTITVNTPSITLSSNSKTLTVGDTAILTATTIPGGQNITWTSSNTSVATVSGGTITAKAKGTATITAKFTYNGIAYSEVCDITVAPKSDDSKTFVVADGIYYEVEPGQTFTYVYNLACDVDIINIQFETYYDSTGLVFLPDVDSNGQYTGKEFPNFYSVYNFDIDGMIVCNFSILRGVSFPINTYGEMSDKNQLIVAQFKVTGDAGVYEINTKIKNMSDMNINPIIYDYELVNNTVQVERNSYLEGFDIPKPTYTIGDVNGDGYITIFDVTEIQLYIAKLTTLTNQQLLAADVNKDGDISIFDATQIQLFIANIITSL